MCLFDSDVCTIVTVDETPLCGKCSENVSAYVPATWRRRECNSRDMDFTRSRTRGLDHISGQDSRPKKTASVVHIR